VGDDIDEVAAWLEWLLVHCGGDDSGLLAGNHDFTFFIHGKEDVALLHGCLLSTSFIPFRSDSESEYLWVYLEPLLTLIPVGKANWLSAFHRVWDTDF
jgi:hypothetical protein